jgi:hypothetical protein
MRSLLRSKLAAMGAAVVNLALGTCFEVISDVSLFERRLVEAGVGSILDGSYVARERQA